MELRDFLSFSVMYTVPLRRAEADPTGSLTGKSTHVDGGLLGRTGDDVSPESQMLSETAFLVQGLSGRHVFEICEYDWGAGKLQAESRHLWDLQKFSFPMCTPRTIFGILPTIGQTHASLMSNSEAVLSLTCPCKCIA